MSTMHRPSSTKTLTALLPRGILPHLLLCSVTAAFPALAQAADFAGDLDQVKITEVAGSNQPPSASFTYSINNGKVILDASGSSDPDGSIQTYKWEFGDGTKGEGSSYTYSPTSGETAFQATLTIIDNANGIALAQQTVSLVAACSGTYGPNPMIPDKFDETGSLLVVTKITLDCTATTTTIRALFASSNTSTRTARYVIFTDSAGNPNKAIYVSPSVQGGNGTYQDYSVSVPLAKGNYWIGVAENPQETWWPRLKYSAGSAEYRRTKLTQSEYDNLAIGFNFSNLSNNPVSGSDRDYALAITF